jgi:hypothetical protein
MAVFAGQELGVALIRQTQAQWNAATYTPQNHDICLSTDTGAFKIGDGSTAYSALPFANGGSSESILAAGALSTTIQASLLNLVGAGAVTLAAPTAAQVGKLKVIQMITDNGDVTLALTNVVGQSSGTTATFNDAGDALILICLANLKWCVVKELGITLS